MVDIVLRDVAGGNITLHPVASPAPPAPLVVWLYPVTVAPPPPLLVLTLEAAAGADIRLRPAQPAPAQSTFAAIVLHSVAAIEPPAGLSLEISLAGAAVAGASGSAALGVEAGAVDLAGAALAGAQAEGALGVGVDLAGAATAGAAAQGELQQDINLAGDAVASAQAEATLDGGGEEVPEAPWSGGFPIITPPRRRSRRKQAEDVIATMVTIH
jgi:hypothetical protein